MKFKIEYKKTNQLVPYAMNARTHSDKQVQQIASSIAEFGFVNPVLIRADFTIIAGHGRVLAAQQLKLKDIPTIVLDHLSERQARALVLADNKIAQNSGWDFEKLSNEISDLADLDFNIDIIGFDEQELDGLLKDTADILPAGSLEPEKIQVAGYERSVSREGLTDDDAVPEDQASVVSRRGDVWILGDHRLMCGDSTSQEDVSVLMDGAKAVMVFTDPPYNVKISGLGSAKAKNTIGKIHGEFVMASGEMSDNEFTIFLKTIFERLKEASVDGAIHYICMDWRHALNVLLAGQLYETSTVVGGGLRNLKQLIIWNKDRGGMGRFYRSKHELIFVFKVGSGKHINNFELGQHGRYRTNVWDYPMVLTFMHDKENGEGDSSMHPTVKPVSMIVDACLDCSNNRDIVLDLFGGSGSTLIACEKTGRKSRLMELDPKYVDVIVKRWQDFTGKQAVHVNGKTLEELKQERE